MGKYGTNLEGFGAFEGGVNADKGAPLVSTSSDGETALIFGPAALRTIQAGVENGDFAIPPDAAGDTITDENPLPYWTFTDVNSAGAITAAVVADANAGSGNVLRFTVASGTLTGKSATLTRYVPVASSASRSFSFYAEATFDNATNSNQANATLTCQFYKSDQATTTGTAFTSSTKLFSTMINPFGLTAPTIFTAAPALQLSTAPADAAFLKLTITIATVATQSANRTIDLTEVRLANGLPEIIFTDRTQVSPPAYLSYDAGELRMSEGTNNAQIDLRPDSGANTVGINAQASNEIYLGSGQSILLDAPTTQSYGDIILSGNIGFDGVIYGTSALTGPSIDLGGTNTRLWAVSNSTGAADLITTGSSARAGILITKSVTGQPTTTINGTGATDAFADALRNGGLAVDTTNSRLYAYAGGAWKFAALTTPSDSRLKEEITAITGALDTLRQLVPVAFKWKRPEAHPRTDAVADDGKRLGFIADQVATTDLKGWVEDMGAGDLERDLVEDTDGRVLAVNIPQNEMEALVVQALLDIDTRLKALEAR